MPKTLLVVQDDLFFAARVQASARRLGLPVEMVNPRDVDARAQDPDVVIVLQLTLNPDRQLALIERLLARTPPPTVLTVSGHLETVLRRRAKALGARLASNSGLDRALSRAAGSGPVDVQDPTDDVPGEG